MCKCQLSDDKDKDLNLFENSAEKQVERNDNDSEYLRSKDRIIPVA